MKLSTKEHRPEFSLQSFVENELYIILQVVLSSSYYGVHVYPRSELSDQSGVMVGCGLAAELSESGLTHLMHLVIVSHLHPLLCL